MPCSFSSYHFFITEYPTHAETLGTAFQIDSRVECIWHFLSTRTIIKSQVLANFVTYFSTCILLKAETEEIITFGVILGTWTLYTDDSSNVKRPELSILLITPTRKTVWRAIKCHSITNNKIEYEVVVAGFELAHGLEVERIELKNDSQLVVN